VAGADVPLWFGGVRLPLDATEGFESRRSRRASWFGVCGGPLPYRTPQRIRSKKTITATMTPTIIEPLRLLRRSGARGCVADFGARGSYYGSEPIFVPSSMLAVVFNRGSNHPVEGFVGAFRRQCHCDADDAEDGRPASFHRTSSMFLNVCSNMYPLCM